MESQALSIAIAELMMLMYTIQKIADNLFLW